jgi:hypothetical protein
MRAISISTGAALALAELALFSLGLLNSQSLRAEQLIDIVGERHAPLKRAAGMQQREAQVQKTHAEILDVTQRRGRCNLLIFGYELWLGGCGSGGLGRGVGVQVGPRAGVDGLWRVCCGVAVGGPFAGGLPSVFQRGQSLLVRWVDAWGCGGERASAWASSGRGQLQQSCGFTAV